MMLEECFELGYIVKPHGTTGALSALIDADDPDTYTKMESVYLAIGQNLVPFFIRHFEVRGRKAVLRLEGVDSVEDAARLRSCRLMLPLSALPELEEGHFRYHEILGYAVRDRQLGALGTVGQIYPRVGQDLIGMQYQGREVLIPVTDEVVLRADHANRELLVNLPEGLLDIYLS
jgi:16S rRNA processing protein RimM